MPVAWISTHPGLTGRLAVELGVTKGAVSKWKRIPAARVLAVSRATGIAPSVLRPDIYPPSKRTHRKVRGQRDTLTRQLSTGQLAVPDAVA